MIRKYWSATFLFVVVSIVAPEPIIRAQFSALPLNWTGNYTCLFDGQFVQWLVTLPGGAPLTLAPGGNPVISSALYQDGVAMLAGSPWTLAVNASLRINGTVLMCTSLVNGRARSSPSVEVSVFDRPEAPTKVAAIAIGEGKLELVWIPPYSPSGVTLYYAVLVADLGSSRAPQVIGPLWNPRCNYSWPAGAAGTPSCRQYQFTVTARNDAGVSGPSRPIISSIPTAPQISAITGTLVFNGDGSSGLTAVLFFVPAQTCDDYPVEWYEVEVSNDISSDSATVKRIIPPSAINTSIAQVHFNASDGIQPNTRYVCSLVAHNSIGVSLPSSALIYTTDVQWSAITGGDHLLNVTCSFVEGTQAKGCAVCLERSGEVVYQMVPRVNETAQGVVRTEFPVDCYNISVVDWEQDGSIGSLNIPLELKASKSTKPCNKADLGTQTIMQYVATISGVIGGVIFLLAAIIVVVAIERHRSNNKRKFTINQDKVESFSTKLEIPCDSSFSLHKELQPDGLHQVRDNSTPISSSSPNTAESMLSICSEGTMV